jgi:cytochrome c-type biogenesis protein CcmH/NrfG
VVFGDIFRSPDLGGWSKALWTIFIIVLPYLGVLVYLIARGSKMGQHAQVEARHRDAEFRQYVQTVTTDTPGTADEIARLDDLRKQGVITDAEFQQAKAKALS